MQTQSTLPIGDARPYFVFALILATIALLISVIPQIAHGTEIDVYQGSTEYVISAEPTELATIYYNPSVVVLRNQIPPPPDHGSTWPIRIELVAADRTSERNVEAGVLTFQGNPVNRIIMQDQDKLFCDGIEPDNDADLGCIGRLVQ